MTGIFEKTKTELPRVMEADGFLVAFPTHWSATRGKLGNEVRSAYEVNPRRVILAWLDDPAGHSVPGVDIPPEQQNYLRPSPNFESAMSTPSKRPWPSEREITSGKTLPVLSRDLDDLIVRIQWLWGNTRSAVEPTYRGAASISCDGLATAFGQLERTARIGRDQHVRQPASALHCCATDLATSSFVRLV